MDEIVFFVIQIVIIFLANRASKKLLSNLHMCRESATCNRFREHLFPRSGGGKSRNTRARLILALGVKTIYACILSGCPDRFLCTFFSKVLRYSVATFPRLWVAKALVMNAWSSLAILRKRTPMPRGVISSSRPWILDHTTSALTERRRSGALMVMSKISFSLRGFGQRIKALIALKFRVSPAISPLSCWTMTGHLTSTLELWRLSLLTGHLPVQGWSRLGHRPENYSTSWSCTAIQFFPVCWLSPCAVKHSEMG